MLLLFSCYLTSWKVGLSELCFRAFKCRVLSKRAYSRTQLIVTDFNYLFAVLADFKGEQEKVRELEEKLKALEEQRLKQQEENRTTHQDEISALKAKHEEEVNELKQQLELVQKEKQEKEEEHEKVLKEREEEETKKINELTEKHTNEVETLKAELQKLQDEIDALKAV